MFGIVFMTGLLFLINSTVGPTSDVNQNVFAYTVKVRDTVENLDKILERAELNISVMGDSISYSYDASKQQSEAYNLKFIEGVNGLVKSVLANSPGVDGAWFQLNADLPFSAHAYNWYEFKDNQFINVKDQFEDSSSKARKITPDDDPYYFNAVSNQKPVWSDIYTDADTKKSMMTISSPIYKDGTLVGVVGIDISMDKVQEVLREMQAVIGDSELYLLDRKNKVILTELSYKHKSSKDNPLILNLFGKNQRGPIEYYDNFIKKTAINLVLSNGYKIVIAIDNRVLFGEVNHLVDLIYALYGLLVALIILAFAASLRLTKKDRTADAGEVNS